MPLQAVMFQKTFWALAYTYHNFIFTPNKTLGILTQYIPVKLIIAVILDQIYQDQFFLLVCLIILSKQGIMLTTQKSYFKFCQSLILGLYLLGN